MPIFDKCGEEKPSEEFAKAKSKGYRQCCEDCYKKRRAEIIHKSYAKKVGKGPAECVFPEWYGKRTPEEKKAVLSKQKRRYYQKNKVVLLGKVKARAEKNKDAIRAYQAEWTSVEENRERKNKKVREWRKNNPARVNELSNAHRARKIQAQPKWLNIIQLAQISEMYEIAQARTMQTGIEHHVDHIFPLHHKKFRGLHVPWNLQVIPGRDNQRKRQSLPPEMRHMLFDDVA